MKGRKYIFGQNNDCKEFTLSPFQHVWECCVIQLQFDYTESFYVDATKIRQSYKYAALIFLKSNTFIHSCECNIHTNEKKKQYVQLQQYLLIHTMYMSTIMCKPLKEDNTEIYLS